MGTLEMTLTAIIVCTLVILVLHYGTTYFLKWLDKKNKKKVVEFQSGRDMVPSSLIIEDDNNQNVMYEIQSNPPYIIKNVLLRKDKVQYGQVDNHKKQYLEKYKGFPIQIFEDRIKYLGECCREISIYCIVDIKNSNGIAINKIVRPHWSNTQDELDKL